MVRYVLETLMIVIVVLGITGPLALLASPSAEAQTELLCIPGVDVQSETVVSGGAVYVVTRVRCQDPVAQPGELVCFYGARVTGARVTVGGQVGTGTRSRCNDP